MKFQPRLILGIALLLLPGLPVRAQERAQEDAGLEPARFLIEKITVEGPKQAAENIVRAETLLREGGSYTEDQLRLAIYRIHRLPFVLDASFSLRKGSERGSYELVIEAQPTRWFFFDGWIRGSRFGERIAVEESPRAESSADLDGLVGARRFVGRSGVVFGALDTEEGFQAGFTQYDLFHRGILASAVFSSNTCCVEEVLPLALDPTFSTWSFRASRKASLGLAIPLGGRQSFQVSLSERQGEAENRRGILLDDHAAGPTLFANDGDLFYRRAEGKWVYDTSDDPILPTRGLSVSAGLEAARFDTRHLTELRAGDGEQLIAVRPFHSDQVVAAVSGIRHWPLGSRQTVSVLGRLTAGQSRLENLVVDDQLVPRTDLDTFGGSVGLRHALTFRRSGGAGRFGDLRLEMGVEAGVETTSPNEGPSPLERLSASMALIFRNQWGRFRTTLTYLNFGKVLP